MSRLRDVSGLPAPGTLDLWEPTLIAREEIEADVERLAAIPRPENGRRESIFVHPRATAPGWGLAPGIRVTLSVLKPGERTAPIRHNSTQVNFCIRGSGVTEIAGRSIAYRQFDVWNTPSYQAYMHFNDGNGLQARLTYSNAPLLEMLNIHVVDDDPPLGLAAVRDPGEDAVRDDPRRKSAYGMIRLENGSLLMPYEALINPEIVRSRPYHWPWPELKRHLDRLEGLGQDYLGRRLYMMYNPMTGRTNGITPSFFATITIRPPGIVDRPHRHISAAINYYFHGTGHSTVEGRRYDWKAGDLMLSAPGWATHAHAAHDEPVYELTVQDQPLNIAMESLLWQEDLDHPAALLGSETGFGTNRSHLIAAE
jgi:gentisate 1,2-dioxygenase